MKRFLIYIPMILAIALLMTGCRSSKNVTSGLGKAEMKLAKERYEAVVDRNFKFENLQAKMKYSMDGGKSLSGKLNIEHGKRLCMTLTVMGIEVARVEADQETVTVVEKIDKVYARVPIAEAAAKIGLENEAKLEAVEALLLGRMFVPGKGLADKSDFNKLVWYPMENSELQADYISEKYDLSYVMNSNNYLVATQVKVKADASDEAQNQKVFVWEYASPVEIEGGSLPTEETLSMTGARNLSASISISSPSVSKKNWNSFSPGSNYREVSFAELIEIVKKLKN